jgi:hypothetical protein
MKGVIILEVVDFTLNRVYKQIWEIHRKMKDDRNSWLANAGPTFYLVCHQNRTGKVKHFISQ